MATDSENPSLTLTWTDPLSGQIREKTYSLPISLGRDPGNTVAIPSTSISRQHATIDFVESKVVITDLKSSNGTYVNGDQITSSRLVDGDRLLLGDVSISVKFAASRRTTRPTIDTLFAAVEHGEQESTITLSSLKGKPIFAELPPTTLHNPLKGTQQTAPLQPTNAAANATEPPKLTGDALKDFITKRVQKDIDKDIAPDIDQVASAMGKRDTSEEATVQNDADESKKKGFFRRLFGG